MKISDPDRDLLRELQTDASRPLSEIGEKVGMAQSTVSRKIAEFEAAGLIKGRVVLLDPAKAGAKLCVFASVSLEDHSEASVHAFAAVVAAHSEILECHAVSGTSDYILKIRVADVEAYETFMTHVLLRNRHVRSVVSSFSLREIKSSIALPL
ncbi:MAG: Lrp/AsnC family transcriptional regulator [Pseudomonadota bacterium]